MKKTFQKELPKIGIYNPLQPLGRHHLWASKLLYVFMLLFTLRFDKRMSMLKTSTLYRRYSNYFKGERYSMYSGISLCNFILLNTNNTDCFLFIYSFLLVSATKIWSREQQFELLCQLNQQIDLELHGAYIYPWLLLELNLSDQHLLLAKGINLNVMFFPW